MKDHKELKGGIVPLFLSVVLGEAASGLAEQKLEDERRRQENIAYYEERQRRNQLGQEVFREQQRQLAEQRKEEQELRAIEMAAMSKIYQKEKELQQKAASADIGRAKQRQSLQRELEQGKSNIRTEIERLAEQQKLQKSSVEAQRQLTQQQREAENLARMRTIQQKAIAQVRKQFTPAPAVTRRLPSARSTALLTGKGYDNEVLGMLQSYYGISLKDAKKMYKSHF